MTQTIGVPVVGQRGISVGCRAVVSVVLSVIGLAVSKAGISVLGQAVISVVGPASISVVGQADISVGCQVVVSVGYQVVVAVVR